MNLQRQLGSGNVLRIPTFCHIVAKNRSEKEKEKLKET
jgi:hypothetical protein